VNLVGGTLAEGNRSVTTSEVNMRASGIVLDQASQVTYWKRQGRGGDICDDSDEPDGVRPERVYGERMIVLRPIKTQQKE